MNNRRFQFGVALSGLIFVCVVFGSVALMGMKLFPLYSEKMKVDQALSKIEQTKDAVRMSKTDIVKSVMRQFEVSDVDRWGTQEFTKLLDVKNLKGGKGKIVSLEYEIRVPFFSNLDVVMNYNRSVTLTKSLSE